MDNLQSDGWDEYRLHVTSELDRLSNKLESLEEKVCINSVFTSDIANLDKIVTGNGTPDIGLANRLNELESSVEALKDLLGNKSSKMFSLWTAIAGAITSSLLLMIGKLIMDYYSKGSF